MKMEELAAPGFRFFPTEEELVSFYLNNKLHHQRSADLHRVIPELNIYDFEPWQLPQYAGEVCRGDMEQWFFFVPRKDREVQGGRPNRTTAFGYWKATGSAGYVYSSSNRAIGVKKTMVFYAGKAPTGRKTKWKMNEYKAIADDEPVPPLPAAAGSCSNSASLPHTNLRMEYSICRVYVTSGNFRAFDRRPSGVVENEHKDDMLSHSVNWVGETSIIQEPTAAGDGEDIGGGADTEEANDDLNMDCVAEFSWDQMDIDWP